MWRIIGAAIVASGIYIYTQEKGDPTFSEFGLWFSIGAFFFLVWWWRKKPKKFCAWCGEKSGLTKEKEYEGKYVWDNQDASGLKIKGHFNFEKANYYTFWRCKKCSALTELEHNMDKNPSSSVKVIAVFLSKEGEGERTAKDWQMKGILDVADSSGGREII